MLQVLDELQRLRRRTRAMLIVQRAAVVVAWVLGAALVLILLDFVFRLPSAIRVILLAAGLCALGAGLWRYLLSALEFRPTLTQLALRVEKSLPTLAGRLATSVEFSLSGIDEKNALAARSVRETQSRLAGASVRSVMRPGRTLRDVSVMLLIAILAAALAGAYPVSAHTGISRLLLPYGDAQWPARTAVASLMHQVLEHEGVHARGVALTLRAQNLTRGGPDERVDAHFRVQRDGSFETWQRIVLTHQGGGVHERLVDADAEAIDVYFATEDARTPTEHIRLVPLPTVVRAALIVTPPPYAEGRSPPLEADLGPGLDERAITERASLIGSEAALALQMNKPLPVPDEPGEREVWMRATFGWYDDPLPQFTVDPDDASRWRLAWSLQATRTLALSLVEENGLTNIEPITFRIDAAEDLPPTVTITEPQSDETALPTAVIELAGEAKDDVAVQLLGLEAQLAPGGSAGTTDLPFAPTRVVDAATAGIEAELDLAPLNLNEGDVVLVTAFADDIYELNGARHERVRSPERRIRIIGELDFAAQLRRQLSGVRQNAIRIEAIQSELQDDVIDAGVQPGLQRAQAQLADRIADQREIVEQLQDQLQRNRLDDEQLAELLQQSSDALDYAGRAANQAVEAIEQRAGQPDEEQPERDPELRLAAEADRPIVQAQQEVREELTDLIELLDRDEDTWFVQRQLENLIDQQAQLEGRTTNLSRETLGQDLADLTDEQRSELEQIAQRQREFRDRARRLIDEMRRRADALEELDPRSAQGMRNAADTGEEREVDRDMETAARRAEQNQLQSAAASQESARRTLQRMLDETRETKRARAEELLRQLASLIESIDRLIFVQETELIAMAQSEADGDFTGRDRAMIRLNQNTQSVAAEARAAGQEARRIARALDRAADAQGAAVVALRSDPIDPQAAREAEDRSLEMLNEAKKLAEELQQQTQNDQVQKKREELIERYRQLAEKQLAVRADTVDLAAVEELDRRGLVAARRLGNEQEEIRQGLTEVEDSTEEIVDSSVFSFVHDLMDGWSKAASDALWQGDVDVDVTDRQQMIADSILRQIEAIEEMMNPPEEFAENAEQGEGGAGGGPPPLIPPVAEIRRLHGLQEQVYVQTRNLDSRADLGSARLRERLRELGQMQRELMRIGEEILEQLQTPEEPEAEHQPLPR